MAIAPASDQVRAAEDHQYHDGTESRDQQAVVEVRIIDAREGQDEAQIEVDDVDHRQEILVRSGILHSGDIRVLYVDVFAANRWRRR